MFSKFLKERIISVKVSYFKQISGTSNIAKYLGYNHRFKRRLHKSHPNIWEFIDSIRKEVHTVHDLITQVNCGMQPREKRSQSKIAERRIKELYNRFDHNQITADELLQKLSFFVANEK